MGRGGAPEQILREARENMNREADVASVDPANPLGEELVGPSGNIAGSVADRQAFQDLLAERRGMRAQAPPPEQTASIPPEAAEAATMVLSLEESGQLPPFPEGYRTELQTLASGRPPAPPSASALPGQPPAAPPEVAPLPPTGDLRREALLT